MAVKVRTKKGNVITLLNPSEKGKKYAKELKTGRKITNSGSYKLDSNKKSIKLTPAESAYRGGYLDAQKDSAKAFKAKQRKRR